MRNRVSSGIDNRSVIQRVLASDLQFLYLPLHAQGSSAAATAIYSNVDGMPDEATVAGTTTNTWAKAGRMTFSGDNYIELMKNDARRLAWLAPANGKHVIVGYHWYEQSNPSGVSEVHWSDTLSSSTGGFGARRNMSDGALNMRWRASGGSDATNSFKDVVTTVPVQANAEAVTLQHWNFRDSPTSTLYINGAVQDSDAVSGSLALLNVTHALTIGASSSNNTPTAIAGAGSSGATMSDFFIIVTDADIAADVATLAAQQHHYRKRLPAMLLDWT